MIPFLKKWHLPLLGLPFVAILGWGFANSASGGAITGLYSHARLAIVAAGYASWALRRIPSVALQSRLCNAAASAYSKAWEYSGKTRGVIIASMLVAHLFTVVLMPDGRVVSSGRAFLLSYVLNLSIMLWFASQVSFVVRAIIQEGRLEEDGATDTKDVWGRFFFGAGSCTLFLSDWPGGLLGHSTTAVRERLQRRIEVLKLSAAVTMYGQAVRKLDRCEVRKDRSAESVRGLLDLQAPGIIVGGPRSNPLTAMFLADLAERYEAKDGGGTPVWRVEKPATHSTDVQFIEQTGDLSDCGIYLNGRIGFHVRRTASASCGLAYFAWREGKPLCVIAGHNQSATEEIARFVLNCPIDDAKIWAKRTDIERVIEIWFSTEQEGTIVKVRTYDRGKAMRLTL
jgi:hypothetical protein